MEPMVYKMMDEKEHCEARKAIYRAHELMVEVTRLGKGASIENLLRKGDAEGIAAGLEPYSGIAQVRYMAERINNCGSSRSDYERFYKMYEGPVPDSLSREELDEAFIGLGVFGRRAEVIGYLLNGLSDKEIAEVLRIGMPTLLTHKSRLFKKFGVGDRTELVSYVLGYIGMVEKGKRLVKLQSEIS